MKNILIAVFTVVLAASCVNNPRIPALENVMSGLKEQCPIKAAEELTIIDAYIEDNAAVEEIRFETRVKADFDSLKVVSEAKSAILANFKDLVKADGMVRAASAAKAPFKYIYKDRTGTEIYCVEILPEDYKRLPK